VSVADRVRDLVLPVLAERDLELYDIEMAGPVLRVVVDNAGQPGGLDLAVVADATRAVSRLLDDVDPISGKYTLEVTSPGLERTLRTPLHFERAVGEKVKVKTVADADGDRRVEGILEAADDEGIVVRTDGAPAGGPAERRLRYEDIVRARTVFEWGPAAKPNGATKGAGAKAGQRRTAAGTSDEKRERKS
jgi:ribosome maturation factor RimP